MRQSRGGVAGILLLVAGSSVAIVSVQADHLALGSGSGTAGKQTAAIAVGLLLAATGVVLGRKTLRELLGPTLRALSKRHRLVPIAVAVAVYGGALGITWDELPPRGDEPHYMLEAYSLAIDRDRNLASDYADPSRTAPMFGRYVSSVHAFNFSGDPAVAYSQHSAGLPLLLIPAAVLSDDPRLMRIEMVLIAVALAYLLLSVLRRMAGGGGPLVYLVWAGVAFSLPVVSYSAQLYPELPGALLVLLSVRLLLEPKLDRWAVLTVSCAAGFLPWLHFRFGLLSLAIVLALIVRTVPRRALSDRRELVRVGAPVVGPFLLALALLAIGHVHWYGSPSPTASTTLQNPRPEFDLPWSYSHSLGGLFQPVYGWLPFAPLHILALVGLAYLCWQRRGWAIYGAGVALFYLFATGSAKPAGGGFAFPARYQLIVIALAALPLYALLREVRVARLVALPLAALTWAITVMGVLRIDQLIYASRPNTPALPLVEDLAVLWPQVAPTDASDYPDLLHMLAYLGAILLAAAAAARSSRSTPRAQPAPHLRETRR